MGSITSLMEPAALHDLLARLHPLPPAWAIDRSDADPDIPGWLEHPASPEDWGISASDFLHFVQTDRQTKKDRVARFFSQNPIETSRATARFARTLALCDSKWADWKWREAISSPGSTMRASFAEATNHFLPRFHSVTESFTIAKELCEPSVILLAESWAHAKTTIDQRISILRHLSSVIVDAMSRAFQSAWETFLTKMYEFFRSLQISWEVAWAGISTRLSPVAKVFAGGWMDLCSRAEHGIQTTRELVDARGMAIQRWGIVIDEKISSFREQFSQGMTIVWDLVSDWMGRVIDRISNGFDIAKLGIAAMQNEWSIVENRIKAWYHRINCSWRERFECLYSRVRANWQIVRESSIVVAIIQANTVVSERVTRWFEHARIVAAERHVLKEIELARQIRARHPTFIAHPELSEITAVILRAITVQAAATSADVVYRRVLELYPELPRGRFDAHLTELEDNRLISHEDCEENGVDESTPSSIKTDLINNSTSHTEKKLDTCKAAEPEMEGGVIRFKRHGNIYRKYPNKRSGRKKKALCGLGILLVTLFAAQFVVQIDSYAQSDFAVSGISASSYTAVQVSDAYNVQFTSQSSGTGWLVFTKTNGVEVFRQASAIHSGLNELTCVLSRDDGFVPGTYRVRAIICWYVLFIFMQTETVYDAYIDVTKEISTTTLDCSISINSGSEPFRVVFTGDLLDDDSPRSPVIGQGVNLAWYNVSQGSFQPITTVQTDAKGHYFYTENRSIISPFPFLAKASFAGADWIQACQDDDSVTTDDVYKAWDEAGPDDAYEFTSSGFTPIDDANIFTNSTRLWATWDFGSTDGSGTMDGYSITSMQGTPFTGVGEHEMYVGEFSTLEDVQFLAKSPWLYFESFNATATFTIRYRSLWERHTNWDSKPDEVEPVYTVFMTLYDQNDMLINWVNLTSGDSIPWTTSTIDLSSYFTRPTKVRVGFGGYINTLITGPLDNWDEEMILVDFVAFEAKWSIPTYVASTGLMGAWSGYERSISTAEAVNDSLFSGSTSVTLTNMPAPISSVTGSGAIYSSIYTPFAQNITSGLLTNYDFQEEWRKSGAQTWAFNGTDDGFDYGGSTNADFTMSNGLPQTTSAGWEIGWVDGSQRSWAKLAMNGAMFGTGYRWLGIGTEVSIPRVQDYPLVDLQLRLVLDLDIDNGFLVLPCEHYWASVQFQDGEGIHELARMNETTLVEGHHVVVVDGSAILSDWTGSGYFMVCLEGNNWIGWKTVTLKIESWEVIATYTTSQRYVGMRSEPGSSSSSYAYPRATSEWTWAGNVTVHDSYALNGTVAIARLERGGISDGGIYARVETELTELVGGTTVDRALTIYEGWVSEYRLPIPIDKKMNSTSLARLVEVQFIVTLTVPARSVGLGPNPSDIFMINIAGLMITNASGASVCDMLADASAWTFASRSAGGSLVPILTSASNTAMKVSGLSSGAPSAPSKTFAARLLSPVMYSEQLMSKTFSFAEITYTPGVSGSVPLHLLAGESVSCAVSLLLYGEYYGSYIQLASQIVDEFTILPDGIVLSRSCTIDFSQYIGVIPPGYSTRPTRIKIGIDIAMDLANATTPGVSWDLVLDDYLLSVSDLPPEGRVHSIPSSIHGIYNVVVDLVGDETELWLEYSNDGENYTLAYHSTSPTSQTSWVVPFDTTSVPDSSNISIRVYLRDKMGLFSLEPVQVSGIEVDNSPPAIQGISIGNNSFLVQNTNISISTTSTDARRATFKFYHTSDPWSAAPVFSFTDDTGSDGFWHYLMIYSVPEGVYKLRASLMDELLDPAQAGEIDVFNVTIMHVYPEIISPAPGENSDGFLNVAAHVGTSSVMSATLLAGLSPDGNISSVTAWSTLGSTNDSVAGTFTFSITPSNFGSIESRVILLVDFTIANGSVVFDVNASTWIYVDTISPLVSLTFSPESVPEGGYLDHSPSFNYSITESIVLSLQLQVQSPELPGVWVVESSISSPSDSGSLSLSTLIDGYYRIRARVVDAGGNIGYSAALDVTIDARPVSVGFNNPMANLIIMYNSTDPFVVVPFSVYIPDCDVNVSSIVLEYKWRNDVAWSPITAPWAFTSAHEIRGNWTLPTSALDAYPRYDLRVTLADKSTADLAVTSFILTTQPPDSTIPSTIKALGNVSTVIWGDRIDIEIEAIDETGILGIQIWREAAGPAGSIDGTPNLLASLAGPGPSWTVSIPTTTFGEGVTLIHVVGYDRSLNQNSTAIPITVHRSLASSIVNGSSLAADAGSLNVSISVCETDLSTLQIMVLRDVNGTWTSHQVVNDTTPVMHDAIPLVGLQEGDFKIEVYGTSSITGDSWRISYAPDLCFSIDSVPPAAVLLSGIANYTLVTAGVLALNMSSFDLSGNVAYRLDIDGTYHELDFGYWEGGIYFWRGITFLPDGETWIRLASVDAAGNIGIASATHVIIVDNSPPVIDHISTYPASDEWHEAIARDSISFSFAAHDRISLITGARVEVQDGSGTSILWSRSYGAHLITETFTISLAAVLGGLCNISLIVESEAGTHVERYAVIHDILAPTIAFMAPGNGSIMVNKTVQFTVNAVDEGNISSVYIYHGMPGAGGNLLGKAHHANGSVYVLIYTLTEALTGAFFAIAYDTMGSYSVTVIDQVTLSPPVSDSININDGDVFGSPVAVHGITYLNAAAGSDFQVGAWCMAYDDPYQWVYLGSSSIIQGTGASEYPFEIAFDTDQITTQSSSSFIPINTDSMLTGTRYWTQPTKPGTLVAFFGNFMTSGTKNIVLLELKAYTPSSTVKLLSLSPFDSGDDVQYWQQSEVASTTVSGLIDTEFIDWEYGDIDDDDLDELVLLDNKGCVHVIHPNPSVGVPPKGTWFVTSLPSGKTYSKLAIDKTSGSVVIGYEDSFPGIWRARWQSNNLVMQGNPVPVSSNPCDAITSVACDRFAIGGSERIVFFGTSSAVGYVKSDDSVSIIESGISVQKVVSGNIDDDLDNELVVAADSHGTTILIAFSWMLDGSARKWSSSIVTNYGALIAVTSIDVAPGLPENLMDDIVVATSKGVYDYQVKSSMTESTIDVVDPGQYSTSLISKIKGRASVSERPLGPQALLSGEDVAVNTGTTPYQRAMLSTVLINEIGFSGHFIELYNYGLENAYVGGQTIHISPVFGVAGGILSDHGSFTIPAGTVIGSGKFLLVKDEEGEDCLDASASTLFDEFDTWPSLTTFSVWFPTDNFRCGTWVDDSSLLETVADAGMPLSAYRTGRQIEGDTINIDTNRESDFAFASNLDDVTENGFNPGQEGKVWLTSEELIITKGDVAISGDGYTGSAVVGAALGTTEAAVSAAMIQPTSPLVDPVPVDSYSTPATDGSGTQWTSTQLLRTASGNLLTTSGLAEGLAVNTNGWEGSKSTLFDLSDTSKMTSTVSWATYPSTRLFASPGRIYAGSGTKAGYTKNTIGDTSYYWDNVAVSGTTCAAYALPEVPNRFDNTAGNPVNNLGGGPASYIDDVESYSSDYSMNFQLDGDQTDTVWTKTFDASASLEFSLFNRIDPDTLPDGATITIYIDVAGIVYARYDDPLNPRYVATSIPVDISLTGPAGAVNLGTTTPTGTAGQSRLLGGCGFSSWPSWGYHPDDAHSWANYIASDSASFYYPIDGDDFKQQATTVKGTSTAATGVGNIKLHFAASPYTSEAGSFTWIGGPCTWDSAGSSPIQTGSTGHHSLLNAILYISKAYVDISIPAPASSSEEGDLLATSPFTVDLNPLLDPPATISNDEPLVVSGRFTDSLTQRNPNSAESWWSGVDLLTNIAPATNIGYFDGWKTSAHLGRPFYKTSETASLLNGYFTHGMYEFGVPTATRRVLEYLEDPDGDGAGVWKDVGAKFSNPQDYAVFYSHLFPEPQAGETVRTFTVVLTPDLITYLEDMSSVALRIAYRLPPQLGLTLTNRDLYLVSGTTDGFLELDPSTEAAAVG